MKNNIFTNMVKNSFASEGKDVSASGLMGSITLFIGLILVITITIFYMLNTGQNATILTLVDHFISIILIGSALLGVRKVSSILPTSRAAKAIDEHKGDTTKKEETEEIV